MQIFMERLHSLLTKRESEEFLIFWGLIFILCIVFYFSCHKYFQKLKTKIWLTQGMVSIIPFKTVIKNGRLYDEIAKWRDF